MNHNKGQIGIMEILLFFEATTRKSEFKGLFLKLFRCLSLRYWYIDLKEVHTYCIGNNIHIISKSCFWKPAGCANMHSTVFVIHDAYTFPLIFAKFLLVFLFFFCFKTTKWFFQKFVVEFDLPGIFALSTEKNLTPREFYWTYWPHGSDKYFMI